jgi:hypothetical protein
MIGFIARKRLAANPLKKHKNPSFFTIFINKIKKFVFFRFTAIFACRTQNGSVMAEVRKLEKNVIFKIF